MSYGVKNRFDNISEMKLMRLAAELIQRHFDVQFRILRRYGPIENITESETNLAGLNVRNVLGQVGAGGTEADADDTLTFSRILTCSCVLVSPF